MKYIVLPLFCVFLLSSCYAFLKADKLVYSGTIAKKPIVLSVDSVSNVSFDSH